MLSLISTLYSPQLIARTWINSIELSTDAPNTEKCTQCVHLAPWGTVQRHRLNPEKGSWRHSNREQDPSTQAWKLRTPDAGSHMQRQGSLGLTLSLCPCRWSEPLPTTAPVFVPGKKILTYPLVLCWPQMVARMTWHTPVAYVQNRAVFKNSVNRHYAN